MKFTAGFILLFSLGQFSFASGNEAIHPVPKEPNLIQKGLLPYFKSRISLPPLKGSEAQLEDENKLLQFQKTRTPLECLRAESEVYVSLSSFFGAPYGNLTDEEVAILTPLFEQIRNDADYYIQLLKKEFPRERPFLYVDGLKPCVPKEVTGAYPSGHATLARLYGLVLKRMFPERKDAIEARSEVIATDRVLAGMHHPSDIKAGAELGEELYKEIIKSEKFQKILNDSKKRL